jgi:1,4-alpha-glucan branching enzyme
VWRERLNSDDTAFGGPGMVNGEVLADHNGMGAFSAHLRLNLPPLSIIFLEASAS